MSLHVEPYVSSLLNANMKLRVSEAFFELRVNRDTAVCQSGDKARTTFSRTAADTVGRNNCVFNKVYKGRKIVCVEIIR